MQQLTTVAWVALALLYGPPAAVFFVPSLTERLYGLSNDQVGALLVHRGALFLALAGLAVYALFDAGARRAASLAIGVSMVAFLWIYARAGFPPGPLRGIAIADAVDLVPLDFVGARDTPGS